MYRRAAVPPVELIRGVPLTSERQSQLDYIRRTVCNVQEAYEVARRDLIEQADKQATANGD